MNAPYVHGYNQREHRRLQDQAQTLADILLSDSSYPAGSLILEAGCGVGAQTVTLAKNNPHAQIISVDSSRPELVEGFIKNTFTAMIEGIREDALRKGLIDQKTFDQGIKGLYRTAEANGVFCYTFFKAIAQA